MNLLSFGLSSSLSLRMHDRSTVSNRGHDEERPAAFSPCNRVVVFHSRIHRKRVDAHVAAARCRFYFVSSRGEYLMRETRIEEGTSLCHQGNDDNR